MDNQCLIVLSKFSVAARKIIGPVNPAKLIKDNQYATQIFEQVDALGDEDLILLSLDLQLLLGLLTPPNNNEVAPATPTKYMMGARS
jgi:hypothetical protein